MLAVGVIGSIWGRNGVVGSSDHISMKRFDWQVHIQQL